MLQHVGRGDTSLKVIDSIIRCSIVTSEFSLYSCSLLLFNSLQWFELKIGLALLCDWIRRKRWCITVVFQTENIHVDYKKKKRKAKEREYFPPTSYFIL